MNEQPLNLRASLREIWRHRILVIVVAALCGLAGIVYGFISPVNETAVSLVLLPGGSGSNAQNSGNSGNSGSAGNGINTEAVIARSTPVLTAAGAKVSPPLGAAVVRKLVSVTPLSGQILQIQAQGSTSGYAVSLANAVAESYLAYVDRLQTNSAQQGVAALQSESSRLTQQIKSLQAQIDTVYSRLTTETSGSSAGQQDTTLLEALKSEQGLVALQLNNVSAQIASAQLANGLASGTTRILQRASAQPVSKYDLPVEAGIIGVVIGLLASVIYVLVRFQRGRRLRLRDEFARAAGAPVIASVEAPSCTTVSAWRELLQGPPRATTEWALRRVLHSLPSGRRTDVRVISFAGDHAALTTGPRLALQAAISGTPTALVPGGFTDRADQSLEPLRGAFTGSEPVGRGYPLAIGLAGTEASQSQLIVSLVIFDRESTRLPSSDAMNLLSISPDLVTADDLARLALAVTDSGFVLDGVVVVNPDPADTTTGSMKDDTVRLLPSSARNDVSETEHVHRRLTRQER